MDRVLVLDGPEEQLLVSVSEEGVSAQPMGAAERRQLDERDRLRVAFDGLHDEPQDEQPIAVEQVDVARQLGSEMTVPVLAERQRPAAEELPVERVTVRARRIAQVDRRVRLDLGNGGAVVVAGHLARVVDGRERQLAGIEAAHRRSRVS